MSEFGVMKTTKVKMTAMIYARMLKELELGPTPVVGLQEVTGLAKSTLYDYIRELRKAGLVYVAGFDRAANNCPMIPLYAWGPGEKDKKVKKISEAERARNHRRNKRERELHQRLTVLGSGAGEHEGEEGAVEAPRPLVGRPYHGGEQMV